MTIQKPIWKEKLQEGHVVEFAFNDGTKDYFQLKDVFNTFCMRAFTGFGIYNEWNQRTTSEMLIAFIDKFKQLINCSEIKLFEIADLINKLEERTKWPIPTKDIILKMASVMYFDESESPYSYDELYGREKMERWRNNDNIDAFFLHKRLQELIPSPVISEQDFSLCQTVISQIEGLYQLQNTLQT